MAGYTQLRRRVRGLLKAKGHVDAVAGTRISGWAFADGASVRVEASVAGKVIASTVPSIRRQDIAQAYPGRRAGDSGFVLDVPEPPLRKGEICDIRVAVKPASMLHFDHTLVELPIVSQATVDTIAAPPETDILGPFPRPVIAAIAALWPEACRDLDTPAGQAVFAERLLAILRVPALRSIPAIADYARYLQATWSHCKFVDAYFPAVNQGAQDSSTDFHCKPNSIFEIFPIAHQLYVLRSHGVTGDFAEFGCFKGFSSAMLSFACRQLGIRMHIFDSFEGLPPAEGSGYQPGEYAGSLDEVRQNLTRFGAVDAVEFHKGFYSDTFRDYRPPNLMCLWMDVDLELSSRDLMVVADRLDPRSTLFSHESDPAMFVDGRIVTAPRPDNPISPMLERFDALGRPLTGRFVRGTTGAFWPRDGGIPAIDNDVLIGLARAVSG